MIPHTRPRAKDLESGPKLSPDSPFPCRKEARIGLLLKTSPNKPYFGNRTNLMNLIKAISCPDLTSNGFSIDPGKRCQKKAIRGRLWALYRAQFWRILANRTIKIRIFHANRKGAFYGRIFGAFPGGNQRGFWHPSLSPGPSGDLKPVHLPRSDVQ